MKKASIYGTFTEVAKATVDVEDEGANSDRPITFEPISLVITSIFVQVEYHIGPIEGQPLIDATINIIHDEWHKETNHFMDNLV